MKSGAIRHLVRRVAGCTLFFGLVAPPLGGMLMLLMMTLGINGDVDPRSFNVGDVLGMLVFIGVFSYALGFLPACLVGGIVGIAHLGISRLRWFLLLCAVLSAVAPGLLNAEQRVFGAVAVLPGIITGFLWWRRRSHDTHHNDVLPGPPLP
ncbi:hypothetical protein [Serratia sp. FDAARGOS_506]|uniref:hypothetical protein n=1 Tax=Serratia sp. FDAARGOS_506 TaxID=2420306 RepID=UPI000F4ED946|nr:hypothetical protein [Serratia sp. FDAARGOS_506]AYZ32505.1 hypothetical protein EGY12_15935 [Serratia sp. FDAARGOS_506]HAT4981738.1 hypothetical protein [Serratia marcescens]HAT5029839.1 hypothetical protein [Serratia marcescens]